MRTLKDERGESSSGSHPLVGTVEEPTIQLSPAESHLPGVVVPPRMIDGSTCPHCSGHVSTENGTEYTCDDCGAAFDSADLFLP